MNRMPCYIEPKLADLIPILVIGAIILVAAALHQAPYTSVVTPGATGCPPATESTPDTPDSHDGVQPLSQPTGGTWV